MKGFSQRFMIVLKLSGPSSAAGCLEHRMSQINRLISIWFVLEILGIFLYVSFVNIVSNLAILGSSSDDNNFLPAFSELS